MDKSLNRRLDTHTHTHAHKRMQRLKLQTNWLINGRNILRVNIVKDEREMFWLCVDSNDSPLARLIRTKLGGKTSQTHTYTLSQLFIFYYWKAISEKIMNMMEEYTNTNHLVKRESHKL